MRAINLSGFEFCNWKKRALFRCIWNRSAFGLLNRCRIHYSWIDADSLWNSNSPVGSVSLWNGAGNHPGMCTGRSGSCQLPKLDDCYSPVAEADQCLVAWNVANDLFTFFVVGGNIAREPITVIISHLIVYTNQRQTRLNHLPGL